MDDFFSDSKDGHHPWESEGVSKTARDSFYDDNNRYFLKLQRLMYSFTKLEHVANVDDLT